jgi:hypothetical protein
MNWAANGQVGTFEIHVNATYGNEVGETTVKMTNATRIVQNIKAGTLPGIQAQSAEKGHWYSPKWVKIALIAGAAGAVAGIVLAVTGGTGHATTSSVPITIPPGPPTVGGPH